MIKRFLLLNGFAVIGVVLNHAAGWGYTALFWWTDRYMPGVMVPDYSQLGSASYYGIRAIEQLVAFSIAAFLVVSGFFMAFAARQQARVSWHTVRTRVQNLLWPYLFWSGAIFVFGAVQMKLGIGEEAALTAVQYGQRLLTGAVTSGYYYVPMLIQLFLLSPLLVWGARRRWQWLLLATAVVSTGTQIILYLDNLGYYVPQSMLFWGQSWLFPGNLFWFSLGIVIGFNLQPFKSWVGRLRWLWPATAVVTYLLGFIEWELIQHASSQPFLPTRITWVDSLYAVSIIFTVLAFEKAEPPQANTLREWGSKSFGVYLLNSPVLDLTARLIAIVLPALLPHQLIVQPILWVAGLAVPLLLMTAVSHPKSPVRPYYQYLFG